MEIDSAWNNASRRFWNARRRELALHIALFVLVNGYLLLFAPLALPVTTAPDFLRDIISNIPWLTIHWTVLVLIHVLGVLAAVLWEREFHGELAPAEVEKPKKRPHRLAVPDEDEAFDEATVSRKHLYL